MRTSWSLRSSQWELSVPAEALLHPEHRSVPRSARRSRPIVDIVAPIYLVSYVLVVFSPFEVLIGYQLSIPTFLISVFGVCVLVITPTDRLRVMPVSLALLGFLAWGLLSVLWSDDRASTILFSRYELIPTLVTMGVVGTMAPRIATRTLLTLSLVLCGWSLMISLLLPTSRALAVEDGAVDTAFRGTFGHKNVLGIFVVLTLAMVLGLYHGRFRRTIIVGLVATAVATRSATTASGLLAISFVWFWILAIGRGRSQRDRRLLFAASLASVVGALLSAFRLVPVLLEVYNKDLTFSGRTLIWGATAGAVVDRPLQGYGYAGVFTEVPTVLTMRLWHEIGFEASHTHSGPLKILLDLGLVGFLLLGLFLVDILRRALHLNRHADTRPYGLWGVMALTSMLVMSLAEPLLNGAYLGYLVIMWSIMARLDAELSRPARVGASQQRATVFGLRSVSGA